MQPGNFGRAVELGLSIYENIIIMVGFSNVMILEVFPGNRPKRHSEPKQ